MSDDKVRDALAEDYSACGNQMIARNMGTAGGTAAVPVYCERLPDHDGDHSASVVWQEPNYAARVAQGAPVPLHLTDLLATIKADAWDEGEQAGRDNADDGYPDPMVENPYRAEGSA